MNTIRFLRSAVATAALCAAGASQALVLDAEGMSSSGINDTGATAQAIGSIPTGPLTVLGWIDSGNVDDRDIYRFSLASTNDVHFDIDFANDIITPGTDDNDGLDAYLHVFDATGVLLGFDNDVEFPADPGSDPNGDYDPFLSLALSAGDYFVAVTAFGSEAANVDTWDDNGDTFGQYCLQVRTGVGFDAPANDCDPSSVAEPGSLALMALAMLFGIGGSRRGL